MFQFNLSKRFQLTMLSVAILTGCASAPSVGLSPNTTNIETYLKTLPAPPVDKVTVIVYRDSGFSGSFPGMNLLVDEKILMTIANKRFESMLLTPGPKEIKVDLAITMAGNPTCEKTIFIAPNQINFVKIGERNEYNKFLAQLIPIASLMIENNSEKNTKCGGPWEPYVVKEADAIKDINKMR
jgi:hypothetical protein